MYCPRCKMEYSGDPGSTAYCPKCDDEGHVNPKLLRVYVLIDTDQNDIIVDDVFYTTKKQAEKMCRYYNSTHDYGRFYVDTLVNDNYYDEGH